MAHSPAWQQSVPMHQSSMEHTVVTMGSTTALVVEQHPRDHLVWSIFNLVHMNPCCLALVALYYSVRARDMKLVGNLQLARDHGSWAGRFNTAALFTTVLIIIIIIKYVCS
ncbi:hypothetical protein CRUP_023659 [Coryphaenoides rupestris]|nr:hypothetical protein CRUP_023659 [Coryphaenoides rupestris]